MRTNDGESVSESFKNVLGNALVKRVNKQTDFLVWKGSKRRGFVGRWLVGSMVSRRVINLSCEPKGGSSFEFEFLSPCVLDRWQC